MSDSPRALTAPNRREVIIGLAYIPFHLAILPILLIRWLPLENDLQLNTAYQLVSFCLILVFMGRFLRVSFAGFLDYGLRNIPTILQGFGLRFAVGFVLSTVLLLVFPDLYSPNDEAIGTLVETNFYATFALTVLLAPVVEEALFRGAVFAPLAKWNRFAAYLVSSLFFGFIHIYAYLFTAFSPVLFATLALYLPYGFALAWVYEKSGSIWTSIGLHALLNGTAMLVNRML